LLLVGKGVWVRHWGGSLLLIKTGVAVFDTLK
jgi:hypothetical protein